MKNQWNDIRAFLFLSLILLVIFICDALVVYVYYRHVQHFLEAQPSSFSADAGIVFFGDYDESGKSLGPDSRRRAMKAASLFRMKRIRNIVCVGGYDVSIWRGRPHPMEEFLNSEGIPRKAIHHDSLSFNTNTNWQEACKIIRAMNYDTVIAISAPLHIFRISTMIDSGNVIYTSYEYHPRTFGEMWQVFKDAHHEFGSLFLSLVLKDSIRNRLVRIYRAIRYRVDMIF